MDRDELKRMVGYKAVDDYVKSGMVVGLGTGSTSFYAIERIGQKLSSGELKDIVCLATSTGTHTQAHELNIPLVDLDDRCDIDIAIDGADEVTPITLNCIKGRGGALLREKQIELCAKKLIIIIDESKLMTDGLGTSGAFPVEINKWCNTHTKNSIMSLPCFKGIINFKALLRVNDDMSAYETDNQNYILNLFMDSPLLDVHESGKQIKQITGVVDHGLFLNMCSVCIVGFYNGDIKVFNK
eukprot:GHVR01192231.1.p1 GENE.GHVR01192231.1~~GHVR01192231.1.p1  ORF type:complete len:241 (+),score=66.98 GHVR01192231.1:76-798(+)